MTLDQWLVLQSQLPTQVQVLPRTMPMETRRERITTRELFDTGVLTQLIILPPPFFSLPLVILSTFNEHSL